MFPMATKMKKNSLIISIQKKHGQKLKEIGNTFTLYICDQCDIPADGDSPVHVGGGEDDDESLVAGGVPDVDISSHQPSPGRLGVDEHLEELKTCTKEAARRKGANK